MSTYFPTFRRFVRFERPLVAFWPLRTTRSQRKSLLRLLATATAESLPAVPLLEAWAEDERGVQKHRLYRLIRLLQGGSALPDAVEQVSGLLSDDEVLAIRFGSESGTLERVIRQSLEEPPWSSFQAKVDLYKSIMYAGMLIIVGLPLAAFLYVKITPKFVKVLGEFDLNPPAALDRSQQLGSLAIQFWWLGALAILMALWSLFSSHPGRLFRHMAVRTFGLLRDWRAAGVLELLGVASRAGRPMTGAVSTLARYHFDSTLRHKLLFVRNEVEQGAELWDSMADVQLLTKAEVRALKAAEPVGNRPWVLAQLAAGKRRRAQRKLENVLAVLMPVLVFLLGAFVLFQALGVFSSLSHFISSLA